MLIDQINFHQKKRIRILSVIAAEILTFLYSYIYSLCNLTDRPTENIYRIEPYILEECTQKKSEILNWSRKKIMLPPKRFSLKDIRRTDIKTGGHL